MHRAWCNIDGWLLGIFNEVSMQRVVVHNPDLARLAEPLLRVAHLPATGFCLVWLYVRAAAWATSRSAVRS